MQTICKIDGCKNSPYRRGFCQKHYVRLMKYGSPLKLLRAENGSGYRDKNGYKRIWINGKRVFLHRHLMEEKIGRKLETWEHVHHINHDGSDNRIENLKLLHAAEHCQIHHKQNFSNSAYKQCCVCKKIWPRKDFYKRMDTATKYADPNASNCIRCHKKRHREYYKKMAA